MMGRTYNTQFARYRETTFEFGIPETSESSTYRPSYISRVI